MKTNIFPKAKNYLYIGLLSLFMISCGTYQNSSYYESDGIYSTSTDRNIERRNTNSDNYYKDYFNSLQTESETPEAFTDIDQYSDFDSVNNDSYTAYAGWGDNQTGTIVNIYPNYWGINSGFGWNNWGWNNWGWNNWGMNYGFGWNNWGWNNWGMNYGFGWNNWGYNNWGWNNNYYYYTRPNYSSYTPTRRRSVSNSTNYSSSNRTYSPSSRTYSPTRSYSTDRVNSRRATFTNPRTYNRNSNTYNNTTTTRRSATQNTTTTRQQSNYSRNESYTPSRSYSSPSSNSGSSGRSYGGGNSGGGSSRSSGGGRR